MPVRLVNESALHEVVTEAWIFEQGYELYAQYDKLTGNERNEFEAKIAKKIRRVTLPEGTTVEQVMKNPEITNGASE